ncbi:hypothetical protein [Bradyrhizobium sp.]|uniref:hypothetical protein n=1 Tax=Bradyrhizobium sp. TaxID=376 RepID=UPI00262986D2|nr:hypothetical protein [Bradyrhizobium sp.]
MNKPIRFANGNRIQNGQLNLARDSGKPKKVGAVPISRGMKRQTTGAIHPYLHGQSIDDETAGKLSQTALSPNIHDGMGTSAKHAHQRGIVAHVEDASKHLRAAGRLSARDKAKSEAEGFDHSFIGHKVGGQSLPASKRKLSE